MNNFLKILPWVLSVVLIFLLWLKSCKGDKTEPEIIKVEVPAQSGTFEPQQPIHENSGDSTIIKWKEIEIKVPNPINDSLAIAYQKLSDSLTVAQAEIERYKMYLDAIQIKDFSSHFEDEFLDLTISGKVQGEVKSIFPKYTIKPRTIQTEITPEKTVFRLLGGIEFGNNTLLNDFRYKANLGFQNAKGNIFMLSYERHNLQNYIWAEYDFSILEVKR